MMRFCTSRRWLVSCGDVECGGRDYLCGCGVSGDDPFQRYTRRTPAGPNRPPLFAAVPPPTENTPASTKFILAMQRRRGLPSTTAPTYSDLPANSIFIFDDSSSANSPSTTAPPRIRFRSRTEFSHLFDDNPSANSLSLPTFDDSSSANSISLADRIFLRRQLLREFDSLPTFENSSSANIPTFDDSSSANSISLADRIPSAFSARLRKVSSAFALSGLGSFSALRKRH